MRVFQGRHVNPAIRRVDTGMTQPGRDNRRSLVKTGRPGRLFVVSITHPDKSVSYLKGFEQTMEYRDHTARTPGENGYRREVLTGLHTEYHRHETSADMTAALRFTHKGQASMVQRDLVCEGFDAKVIPAK